MARMSVLLRYCRPCPLALAIGSPALAIGSLALAISSLALTIGLLALTIAPLAPAPGPLALAMHHCLHERKCAGGDHTW